LGTTESPVDWLPRELQLQCSYRVWDWWSVTDRYPFHT